MADKEETETALTVKSINLDGTMTFTDGSVKESKYFEFLKLNPDDYSNVSFTPEEANKIKRHLQWLSTGSTAAIPLICPGAATCFIARAHNCPYARLDKERKSVDPCAPVSVPVGKACPIEINLTNQWTLVYMQEYEIDERSFTEIQLVRELAEIELMLWRLNNNLSRPEHAELVEDVVVAVDKEGNPLSRKEPSALFNTKERLQNRKTRLIKLLVGDRQEKYKREAALKIKTEDDPSMSAAKLKRRMDRILDEVGKVNLALKEATGDIIDVEVEGSPETVPKYKPLTPDDLIGGE